MPRSGGQSSPRLIQRAELVAALDRAVEAQVTLISAPAGSGKTTLLHAWADGPGQRYRLAVVQVQRNQQDSQQFWLAVLSAVRQLSGKPADGEQLAATPDFNETTIGERVLSEFAVHRDRTFLIIDDLHELNSPDALLQLARLLEELPEHVHATLATRDLPLRLHRLRLAGDRAEIRAADLRFTPAETRELLQASGVALSEAGAAKLHERTEGWAAGLRHLLTGHPGSERILLDLEDANAFVVSLDPGRTWFRYHHLFSDLLRLELRRRLPGELPTLHRLAATWFTEHGQIVDAIRHTQAAGDWCDAARLLADHSFSLTLDGQAQTIETQLRVPARCRYRRPRPPARPRHQRPCPGAPG